MARTWKHRDRHPQRKLRTLREIRQRIFILERKHAGGARRAPDKLNCFNHPTPYE